MSVTVLKSVVDTWPNGPVVVVLAAPLTCNTVFAPSMATGPTKEFTELPTIIVPPVSESPPVPEITPFSATVPAPVLMILKPPFAIVPPRVNVFAFEVMVRMAVKAVTAPVPRFKLCVPAKVKSAPSVRGLLFASVIAAPLVLSIVPAPLMVNVPAAAPSAVALLMSSVPPVSVTPVNVFVPLSASAPAPALVKPTVPLMFPLTVSVLVGSLFDQSCVAPASTIGQLMTSYGCCRLRQ